MDLVKVLPDQIGSRTVLHLSHLRWDMRLRNPFQDVHISRLATPLIAAAKTYLAYTSSPQRHDTTTAFLGNGFTTHT